MEQVSCAAMEVKSESQRSLEWQLNELQKEFCDTDGLSTPLSQAKVLAEDVATDMGSGDARREHETSTSILDEALKEISADTKADTPDIRPIPRQPVSESIVNAVTCSRVTIPVTQTMIASAPPPLPPENPQIMVEVPPLPFKIEPSSMPVVANASDSRQIRVQIPQQAFPMKVEQPLSVVTNASDNAKQIKVELPKTSMPIKVDAPLGVIGNSPEITQMKVDLSKSAQLPLKIEPHHGVLTVEVPKVMSVVPTSCTVTSTAPAVTPLSLPQTITLSTVPSSTSVQAVSGVQGVQGGTYRLKTNPSLGNPVVGAPLMVTGVVIPRAPLSSNLISFVDASGNMQLAAVASPIINPAIQIRPGMMVNPGTPLVVRPPAPQIVPSPGTLGTIVPVSSLSTVQPSIFKSTVRAILPNKTTVKTIYPVKGVTTTTLNTRESKSSDIHSIARPFTSAHHEPEEEQPPVCDGEAATLLPCKEPLSKEPKCEDPKIKNQQQQQQQQHQQQQLAVSVETVTGVTPSGEQKSNEVSAQGKSEEEGSDVIWKILSVSSSQGVNKAGELAKNNLFNLVKTETNVVITAPSTAVQDILEELKKQFPDKKFVINYNSSNTTSSNLKNLVTQVASNKRAMKAPILKPVAEKSPAKRAMGDAKSAGPSAKRKRTQTFKSKVGQTDKKKTSTSSTSKATPKRLKSDKTFEQQQPVAKVTATYRSARLRGEKAPELFSGKRPKEDLPVGAAKKHIKESGPAPVRARGRPRKDRSAAVPQMKLAEQAVMNSIRDVEVKLDQLPQDVALKGGSVRVGDGVDLINSPAVEGDESLGSSTSGASAATGLGYNSEIRVGDEFQAEIPSLLKEKPPESYSEHADIIYHPDKGLLNASRPEGSRFCQDFPLYDFVDWSHQDKKMFKRYLGTYKTKFGKYLAVLPNKRLLDVIDHYYSTHSPARDYVLPKKSKHYYLVSKSKQMIAPKGVFGILNEKRKVLPNRRFCANPNIVLYEDSLPTRRPKDSSVREKPSTSHAVTSSVGVPGPINVTTSSTGANISKAPVKVDSTVKSVKVAKSDDVAKPVTGGGKISNDDSKPNTDVPGTSSSENSDNESAPSTADDSLDYALKKARPPAEDFDDYVKELISSENTAELPTVDENVEMLKEEIVSLKKLFQRNKAELGQMDSEQKRIAKTVEQVTKAIGKARKITDEWTKEDRLLTIQAFKSFGKDFKAVSKLVGTKSEQAVKLFYETNSQRYGLDQPIVPATETPATASSTGSNNSPVKAGLDSPVRAPRPMPSILRRKISIKPLNV